MVRSTQKEIRQRAPLWLLVLLALNFGLMSWHAKDASGQPVVKAWAQSAISPVGRATTGVGGAGLGSTGDGGVRATGRSAVQAGRG